MLLLLLPLTYVTHCLRKAYTEQPSKLYHFTYITPDVHLDGALVAASHSHWLSSATAWEPVQ